jgi:glycosyltransferase involved in cell wall biosynthesis
MFSAGAAARGVRAEAAGRPRGRRAARGGGVNSAMPKVSIVMPVYNERSTIAEIVERVLAADLDGLERELIVVDDASTDGTAELIRGIGDPRVRAVFHPQNRGKGGALQTGFRQVTGDWVIVQDADLEYDPADYRQLLQPLRDGRADVVYGSRFLGGPHRVLLFWHYVGNLLLTLLTNVLYNVNLSDMETGYKAFRAEILERVSFRSRTFGFEPEFTAKVARRGLRLFETPISYSGRTYAEGKKITWKDGLVALYCLLRYRFFD